MFSLPTARYNMLADVMHQQVSQDDNGQMRRTWLDVLDIRCIARGISGGGIRVVGSTERMGNGEYMDIEWVKIQTRHNLSKRDRITNIRTVDHRGRTTLVWEDTRYIGGNPNNPFDPDNPAEAVAIPIEFEVVGATPIIDPFGRLIEYDALLQRAEVPSDQMEDVIIDPDPDEPAEDEVMVWE